MLVYKIVKILMLFVFIFKSFSYKVDLVNMTNLRKNDRFVDYLFLRN